MTFLGQSYDDSSVLHVFDSEAKALAWAQRTTVSTNRPCVFWEVEFTQGESA